MAVSGASGWDLHANELGLEAGKNLMGLLGSLTVVEPSTGVVGAPVGSGRISGGGRIRLSGMDFMKTKATRTTLMRSTRMMIKTRRMASVAAPSPSLALLLLLLDFLLLFLIILVVVFLGRFFFSFSFSVSTFGFNFNLRLRFSRSFHGFGRIHRKRHPIR